MAVTMTQPLENGMATKKLVNAKDVFVLKNGVEVGLDTIFGEINTSLGNKVNTIILPEVGAKYVMTSTGWVASDVLKLIELQDWTDDNKVLFIGDTDDKNAIAVVRARDEIRLVPESGKVVIDPNHGTAQLEMCKADGSTVEVLGAITQIQTDLSGKGTYSKPSNGIPSTDLESGVQTSLGKANSAVQKPSSTTDGKQYVIKNGEWEEITVPDGKDARVGELTDLQTSSKTSIVSAINEVLEVANGVADHETVTIVVSSSVTGVSVANRVINVYINGATTNPKQVTTDANGRAVIQIDVPNTYKLVFPHLDGCEDIVDRTLTAAISQRLVEVSYDAAKEYAERLRVSTMKYYGLYEAAPMADTLVTITYDGQPRQFRTDSNGMIEVDLPLNKSVTVVAETIDGYFFYGKSQSSFTTNSSERYLQFRYVEFDAGITVITTDGYQYTYEELVAQQISPSSCMIIKFATQTLVDKECVFALSIDILRERSWADKLWSNNVTIRLSTFTGDENYDGYGMSVAYSEEGVTRSLTTPAIDYALGLSQVVHNYNLKGFLPASQQMNIAWANRLTIDLILDYCRPIGTDGKFVNQISGESVTGYSWQSFTTNKWCSSQYSAYSAHLFSTALYSDYKGTPYAVVPFFAF